MNEHRYEHLQAILERGARSRGCQSAWISSPRKRPKKVGPMLRFWIVGKALEASARAKRVFMVTFLSTRAATFSALRTIQKPDIGPTFFCLFLSELLQALLPPR